MARWIDAVRNSKELVDGAAMLARRCLDLAAHLIAQDDAPAAIEQGGRKAHALRAAIEKPRPRAGASVFAIA